MLLKMPPIINPLDPEKGGQDTNVASRAAEMNSRERAKRDQLESRPTIQGEAPSQNSIPGSMDEPPMLKNDIERFTYEEIPLEKALI